MTVTGVDDAWTTATSAYSIVTGRGHQRGRELQRPERGRRVGDEHRQRHGGHHGHADVSGLTTTEAGGTATFTVVLNTPADGRRDDRRCRSSDTTEGTVSPGIADLHDRQLEHAADGDRDRRRTTPWTTATSAYTIVTARGDQRRRELQRRSNAADVSVTNTDNDAAGITVTPTSGLTTTEAGGHGDLHGGAQPPADGGRDDRPVVQRHDRGHGRRRPSLTFTPANWNTPQTVTVTGVDDAVDDGDVAYTIVTAAATSADANYNGLNAADVSVTNTDNDTAGDHRHADQRLDDDRSRRHGDLHGRAERAADGGRDDRPVAPATRPRARSRRRR